MATSKGTKSSKFLPIMVGTQTVLLAVLIGLAAVNCVPSCSRKSDKENKTEKVASTPAPKEAASKAATAKPAKTAQPAKKASKTSKTGVVKEIVRVDTDTVKYVLDDKSSKNVGVVSMDNGAVNNGDIIINNGGVVNKYYDGAARVAGRDTVQIRDTVVVEKPVAVHDTVLVHDTVRAEKPVIVHDTVRENNPAPAPRDTVAASRTGGSGYARSTKVIYLPAGSNEPVVVSQSVVSGPAAARTGHSGHAKSTKIIYLANVRTR